jgi:hypothetical protein
VQVFFSLNCLASSSLLLKTLKAILTKVCWGVWGLIDWWSGGVRKYDPLERLDLNWCTWSLPL